jgi:hypothetical protein
MKITVLEESADFATLNTEKLFNKLKSHELSRNGCPNHDASLTSKTFVTSTRVGGDVANPTNHDASLTSKTFVTSTRFGSVIAVVRSCGEKLLRRICLLSCCAVLC